MFMYLVQHLSLRIDVEVCLRWWRTNGRCLIAKQNKKQKVSRSPKQFVNILDINEEGFLPVLLNVCQKWCCPFIPLPVERDQSEISYVSVLWGTCVFNQKFMRLCPIGQADMDEPYSATGERRWLMQPLRTVQPSSDTLRCPTLMPPL